MNDEGPGMRRPALHRQSWLVSSSAVPATMLTSTNSVASTSPWVGTQNLGRPHPTGRLNLQHAPRRGPVDRVIEIGGGGAGHTRSVVAPGPPEVQGSCVARRSRVALLRRQP